MNVPPTAPPPMQPRIPEKGGRGKRILWIALLILVLIGGGIAAAAYFFPAGSSLNSNVTNTTNTIATNVNRVVTNTNRTNTNATNTNAVNISANTNVNVNTNANSNANANVNATVNTNSTNVNASGQPASFTTDTDGDTLNDYLEEWFTANPKNADSDGDGFPDGREVVNGYSPLGTGSLTSTGAQSSCARNTLVTQLALASTDVTAFCTIASDVLVSMQVMAANSQLFENLDTKLSASCTAFKKVATNTCETTIKSVLISYFLNG